MENTLGYVKFELEKTQKALQDYKSRYEKLQQENRLVTEDRERIKTDSEEIIDYLRNTNAAKEKTIEDLKQDMGLQKDSLLSEKLELKNNLENHIKNLQTTLLEYEVRVQTLQADLDIVQDFKQQRATLLQDLSSSQQAMEEMATKSKEKVAKLERKYFEEKVRLQKEVQAKLAEMKKEAEARAVANLAARTRHTLMAHTAERAQQATQHAAIAALHEHHQRTQDKADDLRRELELSRSRLKEYAYLTHKQGKEIEGLTRRIKELEAAQSHPRPRSSPSSSSSSSSSLQEQLVDSRLDIDSLKRLLNIKTMELRKIRSLAQEIIEQRSDLEQYFHDSLEHVKAEKLRQIQQQQKINKNTTKSTTQKESEAHKKLQQGDRIKLEDLSWEEKERVLRILFSKINAQQSLPGQDESDSEDGDGELDEMVARGGFDYDRYYDQMNQRDENIEDTQQQEETTVEDNNEEEFELENEDDNRQNNFPAQDEETNKYFGMVSSGDFPPLA